MVNMDDNSNNSNTSLNDQLLQAIRDGKAKVAHGAIIAGANIDAIGSDGSRPLTLAAKKGNIDIVKMLLELGADPNQLSQEGKGMYYKLKPYVLGPFKITRD